MTLAAAPSQDLDAGPRKTGPGEARLCVATGKVTPIDEMIRFVVGPDGTAVPDIKRRLPGRGVWVTATREALSRAIARKAFARSFKCEVKAGADLVTMTERLLEKSALDALAIAHKARRVVQGFTRVESAIDRDPVIALFHSAEAAPDGVRKLDSAVRRRLEEKAGTISVVRSLTAEQLDLALGRANVVHAALLASPESNTVVARVQRLDRFRAGEKAAGSGHRRPNRVSEEQDLNG